MNVGDYVRTKFGEICKLKKSKYSYLLYETDIEIDRHNDRDCNDWGFDSDTIKDIIKSSPNIINLIEVGDYVNGIRVDEIKNGQLKTASYYDGYICHLCNEDEIKSIVTHEQFLQMEYKVDE